MHLFVPGRVCLFGEHSDWAGAYRSVNPEIEKGQTLIVGTNQGIYAEVGPHASALRLTSTGSNGTRHGPVEIPMKPEALLAEAQQGGFWSYIAGVAHLILVRHGTGGLILENDRTDLPVAKGLSSSAAICVLTARAFNELYNLGLTTRDEMELAYLGEVLTGSLCGRMDQGCAFGSVPVLMTFDGDLLETAELRAAGDLHFVIVDLVAGKNTREILSLLNECFPIARDDVARGVQDLLGPINRRIVGEAVRALEDGDPESLGALMTEAQSSFDRYAIPACPHELTAPILHRTLAYPLLQPHVWGGKGVGSQGDGAAQFMAKSEADQRMAAELIERDLGMPCLRLTLPGGGRI